MILFRTQVFIGTDWCTIWDTTQAKGKDTLASFDGEHEARLDKMDVPNDKAGLAEALNRADANHMNWDGSGAG